MASRLSRSLSRFLGPEVPGDELRTAGNQVLRECVSRSRGTVTVLVVIALVGVAIAVTLPVALAAAIDSAIAGKSLSRELLVLLVLLIAGTAVDALDDLIGSYLGSSMTARLRHRLVNRALALGIPGRRRFPAGDVLSRLAVNADSPANFLPFLISTGTTVLVAIGGIVGLTLIDWRLSVTFLLGVPVALILIRLFLAKAGEPYTRYQVLQAEIVSRLLDAFGGVRTIRASGTADQEIARILKPLPELHASGRQVWLLQGQASWRLTLLAPLVQLLVLSMAGYALTGGSITAGEVLAAASYVALALTGIELVEALISLLGFQIGAGRVGEVLDSEPAVVPPMSPVPVPRGRGGILMRGVTVRMDNRVVLDGLDLYVPGGTTVAIVGRSGAGKSVLVSLIGRLQDPDEGSVILDGVPVQELELPALRRNVTYAFERPALVGLTVHDTIAYARPEATRAEVVAAARVAQADRFIGTLPGGYDTPLAQAPMSGGELQRLALARAVLVDARVLVLDDATSSLDTATEVQVTNALEHVLAERTAVIVAHRAATAARANLVAWLDNGRIRAFASHRTLWSDPCYRALFGADEETGPDPTTVVDSGTQV